MDIEAGEGFGEQRGEAGRELGEQCPALVPSSAHVDGERDALVFKFGQLEQQRRVAAEAAQCATPPIRAVAAVGERLDRGDGALAHSGGEQLVPFPAGREVGLPKREVATRQVGLNLASRSSGRQAHRHDPSPLDWCS